MKLVLSTIVVGIVLFLLGWLFYGILLMDYFKEYYGHITRGEADMKIWAYFVGSLAQAFFMYLIYSKGYKGGSPLMEGFRFGAYISLFLGIPYVFFTWGGMPVKYQGVIVDGIIMIVMLIIAAVITAFIHGKKDVAVIKGE
jgi:hypothetical protein